MPSRGSGKGTPRAVPDAVRRAVERTVQSTLGSAEVTRERAQELVDDVVRMAEHSAARAGRGVRGAGQRPAVAANRVRDALQDLRTATERLAERVAQLETQLEEQLGVTPKRGSTKSKATKPKRTAKSTATKSATATKSRPQPPRAPPPRAPPRPPPRGGRARPRSAGPPRPRSRSARAVPRPSAQPHRSRSARRPSRGLPERRAPRPGAARPGRSADPAPRARADGPQGPDHRRRRFLGDRARTLPRAIARRGVHRRAGRAPADRRPRAHGIHPRRHPEPADLQAAAADTGRHGRPLRRAARAGAGKGAGAAARHQRDRLPAAARRMREDGGGPHDRRPGFLRDLRGRAQRSRVLHRGHGAAVSVPDAFPARHRRARKLLRELRSPFRSRLGHDAALPADPRHRDRLTAHALPPPSRGSHPARL